MFIDYLYIEFKLNIIFINKVFYIKRLEFKINKKMIIYSLIARGKNIIGEYSD
jgi:hypothetical protein